MSLVRAKTTKTTNASTLRKDPKPRRTDGAASWMRLENQDPTRKYIFANRLDGNGGLGYYLSLGARVETKEEGGVRLKAGCTVKTGDEIEHAGQVLVSFSAEQWAEIQENGPDGASGQALLEEVENKIIDRRGAGDHLRGLTRPKWMQFQNEIEPLQAEG